MKEMKGECTRLGKEKPGPLGVKLTHQAAGPQLPTRAPGYLQASLWAHSALCPRATWPPESPGWGEPSPRRWRLTAAPLPPGLRLTEGGGDSRPMRGVFSQRGFWKLAFWLLHSEEKGL